MTTTHWRGGSGSQYEYNVGPISARPVTNSEGNYVFARQTAGIWFAVYVGQGQLRDRYDAAIREGCVTRKGATHYHWHLNSSAANRKSEERDVIAGNPECKAPRGCNGQGP